MLVCPKCEFENPNNHKYCQQCGTSLTHRDCPHCGAEVTWSDKECYNCGVFIGKLWQALAIARRTDVAVSRTARGSADAPGSSQTAKAKITRPSSPQDANIVAVASKKTQETEAMDLDSGETETQIQVRASSQLQDSGESAADIITADGSLERFLSDSGKTNAEQTTPPPTEGL